MAGRWRQAGMHLSRLLRATKSTSTSCSAPQRIYHSTSVGLFQKETWGTPFAWAALVAWGGALGGTYAVVSAEEVKKVDNGGPAGAAKAAEEQGRKTRLVVLGSGWGAISLLKNIDTKAYDVTVISPRNYFLFTPLLPEVTSGVVEARSISEPVRRIIAGKEGAAYLEAECTKIDPSAKEVHCIDVSPAQLPGAEKFALPYDLLVVAVGAQPNTFGTPGVYEHAYFLKEAEDALKIQKGIVDRFETASLPTVPLADKKRLLHFVVVGGGPTGVEFAAELNDLLREDCARLYPTLKGLPQITLVDMMDHILNMFDKRISDYAMQKFERQHIGVKLNRRVVSVGDRQIMVKEKDAPEPQAIDYGLCVWTTGIGTRPLVVDFMKQIGQTGRRALATDEWLRVKGTEGVYALGDCATIEQRKMKEDSDALFELADTNKSGSVSLPEFEAVREKIKGRYPQLELYLGRKKLRELVEDLESDKPGTATELNLEQFSKALEQVDKQMKAVPATAQVAAQEGAYLAKSLNTLAQEGVEPSGPMRIRLGGRHLLPPFRYRHLGQFAALGEGEAAVELPGDWISAGRSTMWLWRSVYASKQVSWRTRCLVVFDWTKAAIFGRDSARF